MDIANNKEQHMSVNFVEKIDDRVPVKTVLISVSDKAGLEEFVPGLVKVNPDIKILSTGGTFGKIKEILGEGAEKNLTQVSDYTGQPETQGGLVKTLDFKIYLGILTETYNDSHQADLKRTNGSAIDMVVVNLYPFAQTIAADGVTVEKARANIDIGGPCMVRASAKNYLRVASVTDPADYSKILGGLVETGGFTTLQLRYELARKAFAHTAEYDKTIAGFLADSSVEQMTGCYQLQDK
jgi:phosphoribosylaminoimidazolecarboxamide formyltransferase / IMP cyclohydrolase